MRTFWESDFERFSLKVKEHIGHKIEKSKNDTSYYVNMKKQKAEEERNLWLEKASAELRYELELKERQGRNKIAEKIKQKLAIFRNEKEENLLNAFKKLIEQNFPSLAECFIQWTQNNYLKGTFILPKEYHKFVDSERYGIEVTELNRIVFTDENLYIEYSIERVVEEFYDEVIDLIQKEEDKWLK